MKEQSRILYARRSASLFSAYPARRLHGRPFIVACMLLLCLGMLPGVVRADTVQFPPASDPDYSGPAIELINAQGDQHPRLLFDANGLEAIRMFYNSPENAGYRDALTSQVISARAVTPTPDVANDEGGSIVFGSSRAPTVALHYLLTGSQASFNYSVETLEVLLGMDDWSPGRESNSAKQAGSLLTGASLTFDLLYNDLDPEFREQVRQKIWYQARAMYHLGFLMKSTGGAAHYWQHDPTMNHHLHRLCGLVMGTLAAYRGDEDQDWLLSEVKSRIDRTTRWMSPQGANHEGFHYMNYAFRQVLMAAWAAEMNFGSSYLDIGYFKHAPLFMVSAAVPGFGSRFKFADDSGGSGDIKPYLEIPALYHQLADIQAILDEQTSPSSGDAWLSIVGRATFGPPATGGRMENLPEDIHFPDLDIAFFREGWETGGRAAMFKCGPVGGKSLNDFRDTTGSDPTVAHNDPDANSFALYKFGFVVPNGDYSYIKNSANHNTILIDDKGQRVPGGTCTAMWMQPPASSESIRDKAYFTNWKESGAITLAEGEAAEAYAGSKLTRYRRSFVWNRGKYVLIFDDIRTSAPSKITWMVQGPGTLQSVDEANGEFDVGAQPSVPVQLKASQDYTYTIGVGPSDRMGTPGSSSYAQLRANFADVEELNVASLYRVWDENIVMTLDFADADHATITVTGDGFEDVWTWTAGADDHAPGHFSMTSTDGQSFVSDPDPWLSIIHGFTYRSGEWAVSDWLGLYHPGMFPWVYHNTHGWFYAGIEGPANGNIFWNPSLGWVYTSESHYPWFYQYGEQRWIWYFTGDQGTGTQWYITVDNGQLVYLSYP